LQIDEQRGSDLDAKEQFEDEAEESDDNFIDDDEVDESDSDAAAMATETFAALRNRRKWKSSQNTCPLCADLRIVLGHLLGLD
jgi:hypothetical protein